MSSQPVDRHHRRRGTPDFPVVVVDGVPQLAGEPIGLTIGPSSVAPSAPSGWRPASRASAPWYYLLLRGHHSWLVHRLVTAERGEDLASWLRTWKSWLPTGEAS